MGEEVRFVSEADREVTAPFPLRLLDFGVMYPGVRDDFGVLVGLPILEEGLADVTTVSPGEPERAWRL